MSGRVLSVGRRMLRFHLYSAWNWRSLQYGKILEPVAFFVFLTAGFETLVGTIDWRGTELGYIDFVYPGILALIATRTGVSTVSDVSNDRKWGVFAAASTRGQSTGGYVLSIVFYSCLSYGVIAALILAIKAIAGGVALMDVSALAVGLLVVSFWVSVGLTAGSLINSYHVRDLVTSLTMLPLILSAPLFYDLEGAAGWLRAIAVINPLSYHVEALRSVSSGIALRTQDVVALVISPAFVVVASVVADRVEPLSTSRT